MLLLRCFRPCLVLINDVAGALAGGFAVTLFIPAGGAPDTRRIRGDLAGAQGICAADLVSPCLR